jgi:hypothetical protein
LRSADATRWDSISFASRRGRLRAVSASDQVADGPIAALYGLEDQLRGAFEVVGTTQGRQAPLLEVVGVQHGLAPVLEVLLARGGHDLARRVHDEERLVHPVVAKDREEVVDEIPPHALPVGPGARERLDPLEDDEGGGPGRGLVEPLLGPVLEPRGLPVELVGQGLVDLVPEDLLVALAQVAAQAQEGHGHAEEDQAKQLGLETDAKSPGRRRPLFGHGVNPQ